MRGALPNQPTVAPVRVVESRLLLILVATAVLAAPALAQQISSHVIAAGGGTSRSPGGCRVLEGGLGQPAIGTASGGAFTLQAGYWAGPGSQRRDSVFSGDFEECN
jgi:hypothetical protein